MVYSLIVQRDNALSMQVAEASLRIAEATRADNVPMKAIAEDSRAVALESLRKDVTMRTIAIVTMLLFACYLHRNTFQHEFLQFPGQGWPGSISLDMVVCSSNRDFDSGYPRVSGSSMREGTER